MNWFPRQCFITVIETKLSELIAPLGFLTLNEKWKTACGLAFIHTKNIKSWEKEFLSCSTKYPTSI